MSRTAEDRWLSMGLFDVNGPQSTAHPQTYRKNNRRSSKSSLYRRTGRKDAQTLLEELKKQKSGMQTGCWKESPASISAKKEMEWEKRKKGAAQRSAGAVVRVWTVPCSERRLITMHGKYIHHLGIGCYRTSTVLFPHVTNRIPWAKAT